MFFLKQCGVCRMCGIYERQGLAMPFFKGRFLVHLFYYIAYNMSLFFRTYIGRLSAIYAFSWNWIWATTTWRTSNPKHLRVTRDCKLWRYRITKLPPCPPTSSPLSSTWKASIWATITSKPSSETLLKTWATPWNRWMLIIIAWEHCVRKFFFRWLTSSRCRWVNIYVNFCLQNGEVVRITEVMLFLPGGQITYFLDILVEKGNNKNVT